jgi:radical SAM protein with 4Fe4S-binding SPASM domain
MYTTIIGGEPTLHSEFEKVVEYMGSRGIAMQLTSNGIIENMRKLLFIKKSPFIRTVGVNLKLPEDYTKEEWEIINAALKVLGAKCWISHRIYTKDFYLSKYYALIAKYNLKRNLELAPACPSIKNNNQYLTLEEFKTVARKLTEFSREALKHGIFWHTDAGFHLCVFSFKQLGEIYANTDMRLMVNCPSFIEVDINLGVHRCYGTAGHQYKTPFFLTEFTDANEIFTYFEGIANKIKKSGVMDDCQRCQYHTLYRCSGGCLARILITHGPDSELYKNISFGPPKISGEEIPNNKKSKKNLQGICRNV